MKGDIPERRLHNSSCRQLSPRRAPSAGALEISSALVHSAGAVPGAGSVSCCPSRGRARSIPASQEAEQGFQEPGEGFPDKVRGCAQAGDPAHQADTELRMFRNKIPHSGIRQRLQS